MKRILYAILPICLAVETASSAAVKRRPVQARSEKSMGTVREITTKKQLDTALKKGTPVVIKFYATWCPNCTEFAPIFEAAAARHDGITFLAGDIDKKAINKLSDEYTVEELPGIIFFNAEGKKASQHTGTLSEEELDAALAEISGKIIPEEPFTTEDITILEEILPSGESALLEMEKMIDTDAMSETEEIIALSPQQDTVKIMEDSASFSESKARELSSYGEYEELVKANPVVVAKLSATWCGPCRMMEAPFAKVGEQMKDRAVFVEIDIDNPEFMSLAKDHASSGIPAILYIKDGNVIDSSTGGKSEQSIIAFVNKNMNGGMRSEKKALPSSTKMMRGKPVKK
jgi:thioredoxin-like negative regulator of GroEL